jgi:uncharacterized integral membrane protein
MQRKLIIVLILALLIIVFAAQNNRPVEVRFFFTQFTVSLAALIFVIFVVGAFLGASTFYDDLRKNQNDENKS